MAASGNCWESIILDPVTVTILLGYKDLDGNTLMSATADVISGGHPTVGHVNADIGMNFRFEMSPLTSTDFNLTQTIVRDLTSTQKYLYYNTSLPNSLPQDVLEVSYGGWAFDSPASNGFDAFSVLSHEVGHVLGLSTSMAENETFGDWDYDLPFLGTAQAAVRTVGSDPEDINSYTHIATPSLMSPSIAQGWRDMPSATDILAIAATGNWTYLALPRMDYLGGTFLSDGFNWVGGRTPTPFTDASVRQGNGPPPLAIVQSTMFFRKLSILDGSWVTSDHSMNVEEMTVIDGSDAGAGDSRVRIQSNGSLETNDLYVGWAGVVQLIGGFLDVDNEAEVDLAGNLTGYGTVFIKKHMFNNGRITADGGELILSTTSPDSVFVWDLDGGGGGVVEALEGDIFIHGSHDGWFLGTMTIGPGRYVSMDGDWTLSSVGLVQFNGAPGNPARLAHAGLKTIRGKLEVNSEAVIASPVRFLGTTDGGADVEIIDPADRLTLNGPAAFRGGRFYGKGTLVQAGDFTFEIPTVITTHTFDWGNSSNAQSNDILVKAAATLEVRSDLTGTPDNEYRGVITLNNGTLEVDTEDPWTLPAIVMGPLGVELPEGTLILENRKGSGGPPTVKGQQLTVAGTLTATAVITGLGIIDAPLVSTPTASVNVTNFVELELRQATTWNGGTISGDGSILQVGDATVVGPTEIATKYYDWDGNEAAPSRIMIQPGVVFTINSDRIERFDTLDDSYDGTVLSNAGRLAINTLGPWTLGTNGTLHLRNVADGRATVQGAAIEADGPTDILRLRGHTDYEGGSYMGAGGIIQDATAFVNAATTIDLEFFDMDGSKDAEDNFVELHADLTLNVSRVDISDNRFNGIMEVTDTARLTVNTPTPWSMAGTMRVVGAPGTKFMIAGAPIVLEADVYIDPLNTLEFAAAVSGPGHYTGGGKVIIIDQLSPGSSPAVVTAAGDFTFADSAELLLEIGGTVPGAEHDRLVVAGDLTLDGILRVRFDGYAPRQGDVFDLIAVGGTVSNLLGEDDTLIENLVPGFLYDAYFSPNGVFRLTALSNGQLIPETPLPGDANSDGKVDGEDATILVANWQTPSGATWARGDFNADGAVDDYDATILAANWQSGVQQTVPEPTTLVLLAVGILWGIGGTLRSRRHIAHISTCR